MREIDFIDNPNLGNEKENWWINALKLKQTDTTGFAELALQIFKHQALNCSIYHQFLNVLGIKINTIHTIEAIPFLPISFFKSHKVVNAAVEKEHFEHIFESSGTTGQAVSKHYVKNAKRYQQSYLSAFELHFGNPTDYIFLCLLPNYIDRGNSSLVAMCQGLIIASAQIQQGFYLDDTAALLSVIAQNKGRKKIFIIGVTYALLDMAEQHRLDLSKCTVLETGGMKGRKKEWTRKEVHDFLKEKWQLTQVYSEYGMTELLSQAYTRGQDLFVPAPWMKILLREENDPFSIHEFGSGIINVVDLANIDSCSFIATDDIGRLQSDGSFEVLGRLDNSMLRGCSLMAI